MKTTVKFLSAVLVLGLILNCSKISEKVEEKVNEKVNEKIDKELKKVDSTLDRGKLDSMMKSLDTLKSKADSLLNDANDKDKQGKKSK